MKTCRMGMILPDINPMSVPYIADREKILDGYARRFVDSVDGFDTLNDYCQQASLDIGDKSIIPELKARIRRLRMKLV